MTVFGTHIFYLMAFQFKAWKKYPSKDLCSRTLFPFPCRQGLLRSEFQSHSFSGLMSFLLVLWVFLIFWYNYWSAKGRLGKEMTQFYNFFAKALCLDTLLLSGKAITSGTRTKLSKYKDNHKHVLSLCNMFSVKERTQERWLSKEMKSEESLLSFLLQYAVQLIFTHLTLRLEVPEM